MSKRIFWASLWFVLGFSAVFSVLGILLQTVLVSVSMQVQLWLSRIGGVIIILFGLYLLGMIKIPALEKDYKFKARRVGTKEVTAFLFGAAFAVGWTPCVGPVLGAVLTLAATNPGQSFALLAAYSLGMGLPFLAVGAFTQQASNWIKKSGKLIVTINKVFGILLVILGTLVASRQLERLTALVMQTGWLAPSIGSSELNLGISFLAGIVSFLSPCVLPLIPGFLGYLATIKEK